MSTFKQVEQQQARPRLPAWKRLRDQGNVDPDHILNVLEITEPPVPVFSLVRRLGIELIEVRPDIETFSGRLDIEEGVATIRLRGREPEVRQRFTIAHELGHLLLHPGKSHFRDDNLSNFTIEEQQANQFAASLLMPEWMLWRVFADVGDAHILAAMFRVSGVAMGLRLRKLGLQSD